MRCCRLASGIEHAINLHNDDTPGFGIANELVWDIMNGGYHWPMLRKVDGQQ